MVELSSAQKKAAVQDAKRFSNTAVRVIQQAVLVTSDGAFGPLTAAAVGRFQDHVNLPQDGIVNELTLDQIVINNDTGGDNEPTITLVESFYGLPVGASTLSVHYDKNLPVKSALAWEHGNLRVIALGKSAFTSGHAVRDAIKTQLDKTGARLTTPTAVPTTLTTSQAKSAVAFNKKRLRDARSVTAVQALVGQLPPTGEWDRDTVQRVAHLQEHAADVLTVDGEIGQHTLREIVNQLAAAARHNSVLRLIVDFYRCDETGLLDVFFDPTITDENAVTHSRTIPGPTTVRVGPKAFAQGFEDLVHTVVHEFEHVRQLRVGIASLPVREFLGETIEILSKKMLEENLRNFMGDADRLLLYWVGRTDPPAVPGMTNAEKKKYWHKFAQVRDRVRKRFDAATDEEQTEFGPVINVFELEDKPA